MSDNEIPRSIRFPKKLWDAIDGEAKRCKRSAVKQMEAVLSYYYEISNSEVNAEKLSSMKVFVPEFNEKLNKVYGKNLKEGVELTESEENIVLDKNKLHPMQETRATGEFAKAKLKKDKVA